MPTGGWFIISRAGISLAQTASKWLNTTSLISPSFDHDDLYHPHSVASPSWDSDGPSFPHYNWSNILDWPTVYDVTKPHLPYIFILCNDPPFLNTMAWNPAIHENLHMWAKYAVKLFDGWDHLV